MTRLADELITAALADRPPGTGDAAPQAAEPLTGRQAA